MSLSIVSREPVVPPVLQVQNATIQYRTPERVVTATHDVSFSVAAGDRFFLIGPSGCGKSSLLKAVGGFLTPVAGCILLNGKPVKGPAPDRIMVFQDFEQLLPWHTVLDNVVFPMRVTRRWPKDEIRGRAEAAIERVGLVSFIDSYPHALSGGMKQRVAIARALAMEPAVLLMDEPFASLDGLTRTQMQDEVLRLWEDIRFTMIFVTHSIEEAVLVGNRILLLSAHPGRVSAEFDAADCGVRGDASFVELEQRIKSTLIEDTGLDHALLASQT